MSLIWIGDEEHRFCHHKNVSEHPKYAIDDPPGHYLCLDCGDTFSLIGDTDKWFPKRLESSFRTPEDSV